MLETVDTIRIMASQSLDQAKRAELGQYMTPGTVARFMASLFRRTGMNMKLLDAGAGIGSLSSAVLDRLTSDPQGLVSVEVSTYEVDPVLLRLLKQNIKGYASIFAGTKASLKAGYCSNDYIEEAVANIRDGKERGYTHAILNPPYKKINSQSRHRSLLREAGIETVNLYSGFVGLSLLQLCEGGELVAILPRSFCNGSYYRPFRELLAREAAIVRIHLFGARNKAFKDDGVLQENVIIHLVRGEAQGNVVVSRSTDETLSDFTEALVPYGQIVRNGDSEGFIHIPQNDEAPFAGEGKITFTLDDIGVSVSTGPVVDFRIKEHISMRSQVGFMPLLYPIHFSNTGIAWPKEGKKPNAISLNDATKKMLFPSGFYVVVKRFSSKEEKQRVVARVVDPKLLGTSYVGIENHLNVIHFQKKGLSEDLAYGMAAYLNSAHFDTSFRSFSGHTQVNATDLRQMKYPSRETLVQLGKWAKKLTHFDPAQIDQKIRTIL